VVALAQSLGAGVTKHLSNVTNVTLAGSSYTPAQITTKLQQVASLRSDADTADGRGQGSRFREARGDARGAPRPA
jgi:hypothetical protein